jgi:hypothetical protein
MAAAFELPIDPSAGPVDVAGITSFAKKRPGLMELASGRPPCGPTSASDLRPYGPTRRKARSAMTRNGPL